LSKEAIFNNIDNDVVKTVAPKALLRAQHAAMQRWLTSSSRSA
jgi:hypothetical protein